MVPRQEGKQEVADGVGQLQFVDRCRRNTVSCVEILHFVLFCLLVAAEKVLFEDPIR